MGLEYEVIPSNIDENSIKHSNPEALVKKLAEAVTLVIPFNISQNFFYSQTSSKADRKICYKRDNSYN